MESLHYVYIAKSIQMHYNTTPSLDEDYLIYKIRIIFFTKNNLNLMSGWSVLFLHFSDVGDVDVAGKF